MSKLQDARQWSRTWKQTAKWLRKECLLERGSRKSSQELHQQALEERDYALAVCTELAEEVEALQESAFQETVTEMALDKMEGE